MNYRVRLFNQVREGIDKESAIVNLSKLFNVDQTFLQSKLAANSVVVKNGISEDQAKLFKNKIESTGFIVMIEGATQTTQRWQACEGSYTRVGRSASAGARTGAQIPPSSNLCLQIHHQSQP